MNDRMDWRGRIPRLLYTTLLYLLLPLVLLGVFCRSRKLPVFAAIVSERLR